ncbi:MAG: HlyD family efflux transporter periplasmic adaptor subunit [Melioribacteraceae bacterium]
MKKKIIQISIAVIFVLAGCSNQTKLSPLRKDIVDVVFASGNIETSNQYNVASQTEGYLVQSFVEEGSFVKKGEVLFHIYDETQKAQLESSNASFNYAMNSTKPNSEILRQLNAEKHQAMNKFKNDSIDFKRYNNLIKTKAVSQVEFERAKLNYENSMQALIALDNQINDLKKNLDLDMIKAKTNLIAQQNVNSFYKPASEVDGVVFRVLKEKGELIKKGETIAEIGSGKFIAKLFVSEEDINSLKVGQDVYIELNTAKNKSYKARISKVFPAFDTIEQSFIVEAEFAEPTLMLKSGTQLQANIVIKQKKNALVIPSSYVLQGDYVLVKGKDEKTKIEVGIKTPEWTEVLGGIDENTILVSQN